MKNRVAARMQRRQRLTGPFPLRFHMLITEAALRLEVGGLAVMAAQFERLLVAKGSENITIQVLSATRSQYAGIAGDFTVPRFAHPAADPPLGYFDGPLGGYLISDPGDVTAMVTMFDDLREPALGPAESIVLIAAILDGYPKGRRHIHD